MNRIPARAHRRHDRNDRGWLALRAAFGVLLVFLTVGAVSVHGHVLGPEGSDSSDGFSVSATSEGAPGPVHGHAPADRLDCQLCELTRRGDFEDGVPASPPLGMIGAGCSAVRVLDLVSAPRAPSRGRPSPRAPPAFSV